MATNITKLPFRTYDVKNFIDSFQAVDGSTPPVNNLYIAIAKNTQWGTNGSTGDELNPQTPNDSVDTETGFFTNILGLQRVQPHQVKAVIPRINWSNTTTFVTFDTSKALFEQGNYYAMNSQKQVFECYSTGSGASTVEPIWTALDGSIISTGDNFQWRYLYTITPADEVVMTTQSTWIPIPLDNTNATGVDYPLNYIQVRHSMVRVEMTETSMPLLDGNGDVLTYRQIGLILNPEDSNGVFLTSNSLASTDIEKVTSTNWQEIGTKLIYVENRTVVSRQAGQVESPSIVVQF